MAFGSWILTVVFGTLSLIARNFGHDFSGAILLGASILFGALFAFYFVVLMLTAFSLIAQRAKDQA